MASNWKLELAEKRIVELEAENAKLVAALQALETRVIDAADALGLILWDPEVDR
jgi:hypothetical protein